MNFKKQAAVCPTAAHSAVVSTALPYIHIIHDATCYVNRALHLVRGKWLVWRYRGLGFDAETWEWLEAERRAAWDAEFAEFLPLPEDRIGCTFVPTKGWLAF
jgi:hypothetical protein